MVRKVFLHLSQSFSDSIEKPTAIAMRKRLGGRLSDALPALPTALLGEASPGDALPEDALPGEALPGDALPGDALPDNEVPSVDASVFGVVEAPRLGSIVALRSPKGSTSPEPTEAAAALRLGVLLASSGGVADVYIDRGIVKRTSLSLVGRHDGPSSSDLALVAQSVLVFARLVEGQRVEIERAPGEVVKGTLVEKCRYGAIVELDDHALLGVGFRKVWPACESGSTPS